MDRRHFLSALSGGAALAFVGRSLYAQPIPPGPGHHLDVPFVPTREEVVEEMLRVAGTGPQDIVYDLGCGDGRIPIIAATKFGARGVGIDIDPERIHEARENAVNAKVTDRVKFIAEDLFLADIDEATVVTLYLLPAVNQRLKPKLKKELRPGTRVVSHDFGMGDDWPAERTVKVGGDTIYLWRIE